MGGAARRTCSSRAAMVRTNMSTTFRPLARGSCRSLKKDGHVCGYSSTKLGGRAEREQVREWRRAAPAASWRLIVPGDTYTSAITWAILFARKAGMLSSEL